MNKYIYLECERQKGSKRASERERERKREREREKERERKRERERERKSGGGRSTDKLTHRNRSGRNLIGRKKREKERGTLVQCGAVGILEIDR